MGLVQGQILFLDLPEQLDGAVALVAKSGRIRSSVMPYHRTRRTKPPSLTHRMSLLIQRFRTRRPSAPILRAERVERGYAIRALIVIAALTLLSYIGLNPLHFPPRGRRRLQSWRPAR